MMNMKWWRQMNLKNRRQLISGRLIMAALTYEMTDPRTALIHISDMMEENILFSCNENRVRQSYIRRG